MPSTTSSAFRSVNPAARNSSISSAGTSPVVASARSVNCRTASSRGSFSAAPARSALIRPGSAVICRSRAVCIATQTRQPLRVAIVRTTTSRLSGSSVLASKRLLACRNPPSISGDSARRATGSESWPKCAIVDSIRGREAAGAESRMCERNMRPPVKSSTWLSKTVN
jgi:hypothetical protein